MFHLDNNSGVSAMPTPAAMQNKTVRWFTEGSGNQSPSWPGQDWFNIVQAELLAILTAAGITPDKSKINQLALAIKSIVGSDALLQKNNLSDLQDVATAKKNLSLDKVGNYAAVQSGGGLHAAGNVHRINIDWDDSTLHFTVDDTDQGAIFTTSNPPTAADTDALPLTGGDLTGIVNTSAEIRSTHDDNFRMVNGNRGIYWRLDANSFYLMITAEGDQFGSYDDARPIRVDLATGTIYLNDAQPYSSINPPPAPNLTPYIVGDSCHQAGFVSGDVNSPYLMFDGGTVVGLARVDWVSQLLSGYATTDWVYQNFVTGFRQVSAVWADATVGGGYTVPDGCVWIGARNNGSSDVSHMGVMYITEQVCVGGNWLTIGRA